MVSTFFGPALDYSTQSRRTDTIHKLFPSTKWFDLSEKGSQVITRHYAGFKGHTGFKGLFAAFVYQFTEFLVVGVGDGVGLQMLGKRGGIRMNGFLCVR